MTATLHQAIDLIDQLQPVEQAQLLEVLSRRVARHVASVPPGAAAAADDAWARLEAFRRDALPAEAPALQAVIETLRTHPESIPLVREFLEAWLREQVAADDRESGDDARTELGAQTGG